MRSFREYASDRRTDLDEGLFGRLADKAKEGAYKVAVAAAQAAATDTKFKNTIQQALAVQKRLESSLTDLQTALVDAFKISDTNADVKEKYKNVDLFSVKHAVEDAVKPAFSVIDDFLNTFPSKGQSTVPLRAVHTGSAGHKHGAAASGLEKEQD